MVNLRMLMVLALGLVVLASAMGLVSDSPWDSFGREEGLSGSSVTAIVQDNDGFLWFSTQSGLNRWDGYTMRVWQKEPFSPNTLSHNLLQTMMLDRDNRLWLGTYGGLDRFDIATETFTAFRHDEKVPGSLSHNVVTRVYRDSRGILWVATLDGLNRMDEVAGTFRVYPFVDQATTGLSGKTVRSFVEDALGRFWVGSSGGLDLYDPVSDSLLRFGEVFPNRSLPAGSVMGALRLPGDSHLWLAVWGAGLVRLDPATGDSKVFPLSDNRTFGLNRGEAGELHVGTWGGGMVVFRPSTGDSFTFRHDPLRTSSLAHDVVYGSFQDRGGLLWVATNGGGVSRYNPLQQQFQFLPTSGKVPVLHEGRDGALWAGVYNGGLVRLGRDGTSQSWRYDAKDPRSLSNDILNSITEDHQGRLWVGTNAGVSVFDPASGGVSRLPGEPGTPGGLPDEVIDSLTIDHRGSWWFGTYRSGLVRRSDPLSSQGERIYRANPEVPGSLPDNLVYFVKEDKKGRLWIGTNGGLALYRPETDDFRTWSYQPNDPSSLPSNTVRSLLEDTQGRYWVATNGGGISLLDPDSGALVNLGLKDGLSSLSVYSILQDAAGLLWIATANGLFSFQPDTREFRRYGTADGLSSAEFSSGALKTKDGRLAFGGLQGVLLLHPGRLSHADSQPLVALTGVQVLGAPRPIAQRLTLGWQENAVTFSFAALDFRNPAKNQYAYQLEGFDRDWVFVGNRHEATYTNLWPGTYRFRFKGATPTDVWAESNQTVALVVDAAPWAAWYAWLAYAGVFLVMIYLYQKARVSRSLGQKVSELETLRVQLEEANRRLDQLARLDGLTGIPNRRALDTWMAEEWARAQRQRQAMAVLMIDIDDFKRYNDFYGHLAGDACLKAVAETLAAFLHRTTDFCARYGGEEFVVLLHDTDLEGASVVAQRLLEAVDALAIPHQMATAIARVSVSIGVTAQVPGADRSVSDLLQKADQALYQAKALGRHRVATLA